MTYWCLHYHIIWGTEQRQPCLIGEREKIFYGVLYKKADELNVKIHAAGNTDDHVHLVLSIPPRLSVAGCVQQMKGATAYAINHLPGFETPLKWQEGYGALTIGERSLKTVMAYATRQKEHHQTSATLTLYEKTNPDPQ